MKHNSNDKIMPMNQLSSLKKLVGNQRVVLVGGCFDVFHFGHLTFLQAAKEQGDILVIALESDAFILNNKKRKPVHTQIERAQILANLLIADFIFLLPELKSDEEYFEFTKTVSPHIIAVTRGDSQLKNKQDQAKLVGAKVVVVTPVVKDFSTTKIIHYASQT
jgi:cytidyltransferase-like protein